MAFVLTPRFAPAYQTPQCSPFGFCGPVSRPQPRRSPFTNYLTQVDELLREIDREAQRQAQLEAHREAHRQRQLQLRAKFHVERDERGWHVNGDIQGFGRENISVEVVDEHTVKIAGNTRWQAEKAQSEGAHDEHNTDHVVVNEPEIETTATGAATPDSETASHKSYQATVEDDFEDLGPDASSLFSAPSAPAEPRGNEGAVEQPVATVAPQPQPEIQGQQHQERVHGSFERTFRFPERIDAANVSARFTDGVLTVSVPRAQVPQTRRISIQ
ncbi:HSP20-like chaperone [Decorospora gaudefroyi]|uniref:HSP20-like chaperone n=1 Tax=Decorospora gaudefroyi TaxID=184978 RepID=A0A6A5KBI2_9PLEO|nr:HSP20-like chaperone [Decorospora gaudefroyi]